MRRDPDVDPLRHDPLEAPDVVGAHCFELLVRDLDRLDVDALAQPNVVEPVEVVERAAQVRLEDDTRVRASRLAQLAVELQRAVGGGRVLHVDAHEVAARGGVADDGLEVLAAQVEIELEPETGQLHRDVRVEPFRVDAGEHVEVLPGDRARLVRARDLLAEDVDRRELPFRVQLANDAQRVVESRSRDVARGEPLHHGPRNRRQEADERSVEKSHGRPGA